MTFSSCTPRAVQAPLLRISLIMEGRLVNNLYGLQKMSQMIRSERPVVVVTVSDLRVPRQTKKVRTTRYIGRSDRVNVETAVMSVWFTLWASSVINDLIISSICSLQYLGVSCQDGSYGLKTHIGAHGEPPLGLNYHAEMFFTQQGGLGNYEVCAEPLLSQKSSRIPPRCIRRRHRMPRRL